MYSLEEYLSSKQTQAFWPTLSKISCGVFHKNSTKYFVVNISLHTDRQISEGRVLHARRFFFYFILNV